MRIEQMLIADLKPNVWNPNEMDRQIYASLVENIRLHGVLQPILVRADGTIIKGEKRWRAARDAGLQEITCVVVETSEEEAKLLTVSLSRLRGRTNEELLASLLEELSASYSLEELSTHAGFTMDELNGLLSALNTDTSIDAPVQEDDFDVQRALDEVKEPETRYGDIWRLGRHLLLCGDATKAADIDRLMAGEKAALVVTDPPYNVAVESDSVRLAAVGRDKIMNDDMPAEQFVSFLYAVFANYAAVMDPHAAIYVFHPASYQRDFENAMNAAGIVVRSQCIWVKNAPTFGWAQYRYKHEPVFYAHLKGIL
jgi:ParB/RepB/Spo0J family partition protein